MDPTNIIPLAPVASVPAVVAAAFPIGLVDFNKDIEIYHYHSDGDGDEPVSPGKVITVLKNSTHPVVVTFEDDGSELVDSFDTNGVSMSGDYTAKNAVVIVYPFTGYGVLVRDGNSFTFHDELFATELEADNFADDEDIVFPIVVTAPQPKQIDDEPDHIEGGEEDLDEGDDGVELTDHNLGPGEIAMAWCPGTGSNLMKGSAVRAYRLGFGYRNAEVLAVRHHATRNFFIKCEGDSKPYWAKNKNISNRIEQPTPPAPAPEAPPEAEHEPAPAAPVTSSFDSYSRW